jgi:ATP-dependent DNA helicase RecG
MLTEPQLRELMTNLESDRVERTESAGDMEKFCKAACAFANDFAGHKQPGYLLVGVTNKGQPTGLKATDKLLLTLGEVRANGNVLPIPAVRIFVVTLANGAGDVAVLEVAPSDLPPVRYRGQVWIRVGPRQAVATESEERRLTEKRVSHARTFDARPCLGSKLADLATDLFLNTYRQQAVAEEVIAENHRELSVQLAALRFFDLANVCPTNAGILAFAKNPRFWLPGTYLQFLRLSGSLLRPDDVLIEKEVQGDLLTLLRELDILIDSQLAAHPVPQTALREKSVTDYPRFALREFLMNAVMHRDYEATGPIRFYWFADRIEIQNPGALYGEARQSNFPSQNAYRNPVLAEVMKTLGYVNRYGSGIYRAQEALLANGNAAATFSFEDTYFLATITARV